MREDWVAYLVVFTVVGLMLLGKKMMFFSSEKVPTEDDKE